LPSNTSISSAAVGNTIYNSEISHRFYACVTWQDIDYKLPEDDMIASKMMECDNL
jgi:hypothetical protein